MRFEASAHALAYLGNEEQFPQDIDMLGVAVEEILQTGHEVKVPYIWVQEDIISLYGLHEVLLSGEASIEKLNHDSAVDLANLVLDRWNLPDTMLASHEIHIRSSFMDLEIDHLHDEKLSKAMPECMRNGIANALMVQHSAVALLHGSSEVIAAISAIYNEILIPAARQQEACRYN